MEILYNRNSAAVYMLSADDLKAVIEGIINETLVKKESEKQNKLLTVAEVSSELGVDRSTLWRWEKEHYLIPVRLGSKVRYKESDIKNLQTKREWGLI